MEGRVSCRLGERLAETKKAEWIIELNKLAMYEAFSGPPSL